MRPSPGIPDMRNLRSVAEIVNAHSQHGRWFNDSALGASWSALGKLVRGDRVGKERRYLSQEGRALEPLVEHTAHAVRSMNARSVATVAHGLAMAQRDSRWRGGDALWDALAERAPSAARVDEFNPRSLAVMAHAFATAGQKSPALFDAIASESTKRVREFNPQGLANTAWACATVGHASPALFDAIASASMALVGEFKPQELASTAWAYATVGHKSLVLFDAIAKASVKRVGELDPQGLANTAWAYAACDVRAVSLFASPRFADRCADLVDEFSTVELSQLHQWQLWLELERAGDSWPGLRADMRERCRQAFSSEDVSPSQFQRKVAVALQDLDLGVSEEVRTSAGYSIDVVVTMAKGHKVAVEVDGPSHFVGASQTPNGATLLKRRQLRAAGWALLPVPYWEWDALNVPGNAEEQRLRRREYLTRKLSLA